MIERIIGLSVRHKGAIGILIALWIGLGVLAMRNLSIDAVPDITNNQVQVVAVAPSLVAQEVEQFITYPVEVAMANLPEVEEIRSISRFGLSVVTIVFRENLPILDARQYVKEQLPAAEAEIPPGLAELELMPITTGLGEIYQYTLQVDPAFRERYDAMALREIQDWIVKRQMAGIEGIVEVSSFGGFVKQYEVAAHPERLSALGLTMQDVYSALERNNGNSGGAYLERSGRALYLRTEGRVESLEDIGAIPIQRKGGLPVLVRDVATVRMGSPPRFGAMTADGQGETVGGITLMLKGANSAEAMQAVRERVAQVENSLPEGVHLVPYLDREELVNKTIYTAAKNLLEGGLIVIAVLLILLGNWRASLVVASVIPLSMLFAFIGMWALGVSANLMSLGAIDFGIVVDGAVIVVEGVLFAWYGRMPEFAHLREDPDALVRATASRLYRSAFFGILIILIVFVPVVTLSGIEGKMFRPMALTVSFAILGALLLSMTYVPAMTAWMLRYSPREEGRWTEGLMERLQGAYRPTLRTALSWPRSVIGAALLVLLGGVLLFRSLGAVFIPTLEEGDLAMQMAVPPGSSLEESIRTTTAAERILLERFPEVEHVVSKIGTAEVPTDPMAIEDADIMIILKDKSEWTSAHSREALVDHMKGALAELSWASFEFTQPIQLRFNELMTGAKTDIAVKIFGEDLEALARLGDRAAELINTVPGAGDVKVEQTEGLPQLRIRFDRERVAAYGLAIEDLNMAVRSAYAGEKAGVVFEGERKFDLVLRLAPEDRQRLDLAALMVPSPEGPLPLNTVAEWTVADGPMQVSREDARRRITVGVNVRDRDIAGLVADVEELLDRELDLPPGYYVHYGGAFENLVDARRRLGLAVPAALLGIFLMLYATLGSVRQAALIFTAIPLAAVGGVAALALRGMPFSISAGIGFIALFGVAVLNGLVLIGYLNGLRREGRSADDVVVEGAAARLRPVLMTAAVAALGFLPMALSHSAGAEVQKPLATVVIGGLVSSTLLTLLVLPVLYRLSLGRVGTHGGSRPPASGAATAPLWLGLLLGAGLSLGHPGVLQAQPGQAGGSAPDSNDAPSVALSLQRLLDSTRAVLPVLRAAAAQAQAAATDPATAWDWGRTSATGQFGQINAAVVDQFWTVEHTVPNLLQQGRSRQAAQARADAAQARFAFGESRALMDATLAWLGWVHARRMLELDLARVERLDEAERLTQLLVDRGERDAMELDQMQALLAEARSAVVRSRAADWQAEAELRRRSGLSGQFAPPAGLPMPFAGAAAAAPPDPDGAAASETAPTPPPEGTSGVMAQTLNRAAAAQNQAATAALRVPGTWWFPDVSLGYFRQTLELAQGFQGWQAGLSVPLAFNRTARSKDQQQALQAANQAGWQQARLDLQQQAEAERLSAESWTALWRTDAAGWADRADGLRRKADVRRQAGEIDAESWWLAQRQADRWVRERLDAWLAWQSAAARAHFLLPTSNNADR